MSVLTSGEILDLSKKSRSGELIDESLSEALLNITDTITSFENEMNKAFAAADEANAAAKAAKEANMELYSRIATVEEKTEEKSEEFTPIDYSEVFEEEKK